MQLNRFLAVCGISSRRNAVALIEKGSVKVNGAFVSDPAHRLAETDIVLYCNRRIIPQKPVYILLNKPVGYISASSDPHGQKTVLDLCKGALKGGVRLFPVGRLDIDSRGLILLTNDGMLGQLLAHPRFEISKTYRVKLHEPLSAEFAEQLCKGIKLSDGKAAFDDLCCVSPDRLTVEVTLHSGRNRIVRRMFAHGGLHVRDLRRIGYAGLSIKALPEGRWRHLLVREVALLQKISTTSDSR